MNVHLSLSVSTRHRLAVLGSSVAGLALLLGAAKSSSTLELRGVVVDQSERPLAFARVEVATLNHKRIWASVLTDGDGRFTLLAPGVHDENFEVTASAAGFLDWGWSYSRPPEEEIHARLERRVDAAFLDHILAESDPVARRRDVVLLLAAGFGNSEPGLQFTYAGRLRADLRQAIQDTESTPKLDEPQRGAARFLLALWGDPADDDLVAPGKEHDSTLTEAPPGLVGATPAAACEAYVVPHFNGQHVKPPYTYHACGEAAVDPTGSRALLTFLVRYAHWYYSELLVIVREGEHWRVRTVVRWEIS
jgi:hypothetical protein